MSSQPPSSSDNPVLTYYREWSEKTPYVTRVTMIVLVVSYLISFFAPSDSVLGNTTYFSILNFEVYRLILSPLVGNSIFNIVLIALFFPGMGGRMESSLGSSAFLVLLGTLTIMTNVIFVVLCMFLYYVANVAEAVFYTCSGFWLVLFGLITIECLQNPDQPRRMMMVPVDIPSKFFPLIMYAMFCLFTGPKLDFAISMFVGYLYSKGHLDRTKPSSYYLEGLEASTGMLHSVSRSKGWVLAGAALGHDAWIAVNSAAAGGSAGPQQGSSSGSSAPAGRGGFGAWAAQEGGGAGSDAAGEGAPKPSAPFGGSGRALGGTSSAASSGGGWLGGGGDSSSGSAAASKDREAVAARRLAALSSQHGAQSSSGGTGAEGGGAQSDLQRLQVSESKRQTMADAANRRMRKSGDGGIDSQPPSAAALPTTATSQTSLLTAATNHPRYSAS